MCYHQEFCFNGIPKDASGGGGGRGVLSLEKGTDCSPTAGERWLSRHAMAKKRGAVLILNCRIGELSESV